MVTVNAQLNAHEHLAVQLREFSVSPRYQPNAKSVCEPLISGIEALQAAEHDADQVLKLAEPERDAFHGDVD